MCLSLLPCVPIRQIILHKNSDNNGAFSEHLLCAEDIHYIAESSQQVFVVGPSLFSLYRMENQDLETPSSLIPLCMASQRQKDLFSFFL